ncbi:phosphoadenosine phosphosulfate reductase family protein [Cupriavidus sp. UYPR2.512]|uniref:phosphoadenosine phosphosulfate reductase domain-containing protein n=1 Tax=Cupriavidus sp. UYPR2.512 TaxID=1080187 RepID=UPI00036568D3|nr:phosphoadenosine phosphosulfate reductase family protein [Cupriavidus sp. UYPR2.512]UIF90839.1 phosphoadenosine phosphosulfate reductase family protein [Cupriavidus necator]
MTDIAAAFARHERIAFQFSGGRDSLCALHLLRPYWAAMTVYHLRTGDDFPETQKLVREIANLVPHLALVDGVVGEVRAEFGLPSDLIPTSATTIGRIHTGGPRLQDRYDCCARTIMLPMQARMKADGITLIVRGQRDTDYAAPVTRSGDVHDGIELLYPIQSWTTEQVMLALDAMGVEAPRFYAEGCKGALDCMTCTAWWDEGRAAYLAKHHPAKYAEYQRKLTLVADALRPHVAHLDRELTINED